MQIIPHNILKKNTFQTVCLDPIFCLGKKIYIFFSPPSTQIKNNLPVDCYSIRRHN